MLQRTARMLLALLGWALASSGAFAAGTLRYGLEFDPDILDPARDGSYTGRIVLFAMCDQLLDIDENLNFVPQLAAGWEWSADQMALTLHLRPGVKFHDGEAMDAASVQASLKRYREAPESQRKNELKPVAAVEVVDPLTVRLRLSSHYAPLLAVLASRAGVIMSSRVLALGADEIVAHPACAGPFKLTQRVPQDRIVLDRFTEYWNAANINLDRVIFQPIVDSTVRLVNLRSGALDLVNRTAPTDVAAVQANPKLRLVTSPSIGFQLISFNLNHAPGAGTPISLDPRVRKAFEKSIDRAVINQVVMDGQYLPNNQTEPPLSRYWDPDYPVPPRDLDGARALLEAAGVPHPKFTLFVGNDPVNGQIGQVIQSMAAEAGIEVVVRQIESNAGLAAERAGDYQAAMVIWSGRPDPDQNLSIWASCAGFLNWGQYCNTDLDELFTRGTRIIDPAARIPVYRQIADIMQRDMPHMVLFHFRWLWSMSDRVTGFRPMPDGIVRMTGLGLKNG